MAFTFAIMTLLLVTATMLPMSRHSHWLVRGMDFPRLQLAVFALLLLLLQFFILDLTRPFTQGLLVATAACLVWQVWWIIPYTIIWPNEVRWSSKAVPAERHLSIVTANVLSPNRQADKLLALVRKHQPDVLVTLESDAWWQDQLDTLEDTMPYTIKCPLDNLYGMHVYSRLPLIEATTEYLVEDDVPSMHALLELASGERARLHFLHPAPPSPTENPESAERDAELVMVARSLASEDGPALVTGDLNDVAWSPTTRLFRKLSGLLDPRVGRGMFNTFHAGYPFFRWPLDHLFHSEHFTVKSIMRLPSIGSDHFALLTRLALEPRRGEDQEGIEADIDDQEWAEEIVDDQDVDRTDVPRPGS